MRSNGSGETNPAILFLTRSSQKLPEPDTPLMLFVWGCDDDGSFGLGPDHLKKIPRSQRRSLLEVCTPCPSTEMVTMTITLSAVRQNPQSAAGTLFIGASTNWPANIPGLKYSTISSIYAGNELSAAVSATGDLFVWGAVWASSFLSS